MKKNIIHFLFKIISIIMKIKINKKNKDTISHKNFLDTDSDNQIGENNNNENDDITSSDNTSDNTSDRENNTSDRENTGETDENIDNDSDIENKNNISNDIDDSNNNGATNAANAIDDNYEYEHVSEHTLEPTELNEYDNENENANKNESDESSESNESDITIKDLYKEIKEIKQLLIELIEKKNKNKKKIEVKREILKLNDDESLNKIKKCLELRCITGDIMLFREYYMKTENIPIRKKSSKYYEFWANDKWNNDPHGKELIEIISNNIKTTYAKINTIDKYSIDDFTNNQTHIFKLSKDLYKKQLLKEISLEFEIINK